MAKVIVTLEHNVGGEPLLRIYQRCTYMVGQTDLLYIEREDTGARIAVYAKWASVESAGRPAKERT